MARVLQLRIEKETIDRTSSLFNGSEYRANFSFRLLMVPLSSAGEVEPFLFAFVKVKSRMKEDLTLCACCGVCGCCWCVATLPLVTSDRFFKPLRVLPWKNSNFNSFAT